VVDEDEGGHGFDHGDGAGEDAGVVAAAAFQGCVLVFDVDGVLFDHDGGDGFEGGAEVDGFAIGDSALDTAGTVGGGADFAVDHAKGIVVLGAGELCSGEAGADFKSFGGGEAEHGFAEVGFETIEYRFAPAGWDAAGNSFDEATDGIAVFAHLLDELDHLVGGFGIGTADDVGFDLFEGDGVGVDFGGDVLDLGDVGQDLDAVLFAEDFLCDGPCGHAADGFPGAAPAAALPVAEAVFGLIGVIGVRGAKLAGHFGIGFRTGILVPDPHGNGRSKCLTFKDSGKDFDFVRFFTGGGYFGLAGTSAVQIGLDIGLGKPDTRWTAIDDDANSAAMGFSPGGDAKELAERVSHGRKEWAKFNLRSNLPIEQVIDNGSLVAEPSGFFVIRKFFASIFRSGSDAQGFVEEALHNSEQRFHSIWENSLDAMRLTDEKGTILTVNPAYCRLVGVARKDLVERPFVVAHHPDEAEANLQKYLQAFPKRALNPQEYKKLRRLDGSTVDLEVSYSFIEMERPLLLAIFRDVSERTAAIENLRRAKEFSENLIKTANVMIIGLDSKNRVTIFNQTAETVSGFTRAEVEGKEWKDLVRFDLSDCKYEGEGHANTFEAKLPTKNGEERHISWQTNSIFEQGVCVGTICVGMDITEKKKQEEQKLALERKLLDSQKLESLGVLAGGIAHDFNNLLTAVLGNASLASLHVTEDSKLKGYIANIEKASLRAAELCKQMLAYSGKAQFVMKCLDLNEVVRETAELLEVSINKKASLRIELNPGLPGISADPTQIRQVLMNLVINASEAIGDKSGSIRVRTGVMHADKEYFTKTYMAAELREGEYVYVQVSDTGCGMSPDTQARIFDPFFTTKFTGRGLGLAAVLGIVRGHKGALKIQSEVDKGSTFTFLVPIHSGETQSLESNGKKGIDWKGKGTILVVDDDPTVRAVTARIVEASGFNVIQAVDGQHGVEVFEEQKEKIKAVVLDLTMPKLNGEEAFEEMRRLKPDVKVLLISGFSQPEGPDFSNKSLSGFLQKPFTTEDLNEKLKLLVA
jgi:two-component system cell cycle sensor histidine kinase/response regulator CckA